MATGVLSIRLPSDVKKRLEALSRSTGRPASYYVREAVLAHLDELEWAYGMASRAEMIRAGSRETVPLEDLAHDLGLQPGRPLPDAGGNGR